MAKNVPPHLVDGAGKCIFCGNPGLSETHVWPAWLKKLFPATERFDRRFALREFSLDEARIVEDSVLTARQGSMFDYRPNLACIPCNTGWMREFEEEVRKFVIPLIMTLDSARLTYPQTRALSSWVCLIFMLSSYLLSKTERVISIQDRVFIRKYLEPSGNWSIFFGSHDSEHWKTRFHGYAIANSVHPLGTPLEIKALETLTQKPSMYIASFGIGHLFFNAFCTPSIRFASDYCIAAQASGLIQLWPRPFIFGLLPKRSTKFPTKRIFHTDDLNIIEGNLEKRFGRIRD